METNTEMKLTETQEKQIIHYLTSFTKLANDFFEEGNKPFQEYWKGQVMGICKIIDLMNLPFDTSYYLSKLI
jgi:hypothetical protein